MLARLMAGARIITHADRRRINLRPPMQVSPLARARPSLGKLRRCHWVAPLMTRHSDPGERNKVPESWSRPRVRPSPAFDNGLTLAVTAAGLPPGRRRVGISQVRGPAAGHNWEQRCD